MADIRYLGLLIFCLVLSVVGCSGSLPRFTSENPAAPNEIPLLEGEASYYGDEFIGRQTSNGEVYDPNALTAAHRSLPFNTRVRVTNLENGKSVIVRINDRGPWKPQRILDLSTSAARELGMLRSGTAHVKIEILN
jgi:rare lipoprotein A